MSLMSLANERMAPLNSSPIKVEVAACRNLHVCQGRHGHQQEGGGSLAPHLVSCRPSRCLWSRCGCPEEGI